MGRTRTRNSSRCRRWRWFVPFPCPFTNLLKTPHQLITRTGGFCIQLSAAYPELSFVIQDTEQFLRQGREEVWPSRAPEALAAKRVTFIPHDFFEENPVKGAKVYWLRNILYVPPPLQLFAALGWDV